MEIIALDPENKGGFMTCEHYRKSSPFGARTGEVFVCYMCLGKITKAVRNASFDAVKKSHG